MSLWNGVRNVLCVRLDSLGDVIMTTPALRALKASPFVPKVTLLTSPSGAAAARLIPEIDEVILYEAPWMKATALRPYGVEDLAVVQRLKRAKFDGAVLFTTYSQSPLPAAMLCYQAGIPRQLAYCRENPYQLLTDWVKETEPESQLRHEARRHLDLVASAGFRSVDERLSFRVSPEARSRMQAILQANGLPVSGAMIVIHPGATAPSRCYPAAGFAQVMRLLHGHTGLPMVLTGSASEKALVEEVQALARVPSISLAGALQLDELAALLALAAVTVMNNTGPAHIAAAVGAPVVSLYALTNPQHTPWKAAGKVLFKDVPCRFCYKSVCPEGHHACLAELDPALVAAAICDVLEGKTSILPEPSSIFNLSATPLCSH